MPLTKWVLDQVNATRCLLFGCVPETVYTCTECGRVWKRCRLCDKISSDGIGGECFCVNCKHSRQHDLRDEKGEPIPACPESHMTAKCRICGMKVEVPKWMSAEEEAQERANALSHAKGATWA